MEIRDLPINDLFGQCIRKSKGLPADEIKRETMRMKKCKHLFVLLEKGEWIGACHSSDYVYDQNKVECVHCGLTNKYMKLEEHLKTTNFSLALGIEPKTLESQIFREVFKKAYRAKGFDESVINLISKFPIATYHPGLLYEIAKELKPNADLEEIYDIMNELNSLENDQEKLRLKTIEQASDLITRYKENVKKAKVISI